MKAIARHYSDRHLTIVHEQYSDYMTNEIYCRPVIRLYKKKFGVQNIFNKINNREISLTLFAKTINHVN